MAGWPRGEASARKAVAGAAAPTPVRIRDLHLIAPTSRCCRAAIVTTPSAGRWAANSSTTRPRAGRIGDRFRDAVRRFADAEHVAVVPFTMHACNLDVMRPLLDQQTHERDHLANLTSPSDDQQRCIAPVPSSTREPASSRRPLMA